MKRKIDQLKYSKFDHIRDNVTPYLNQFTTIEQQYVAYKTIDLLIYYNYKYLNIYVGHLLSELRRRVYVNSIITNKNISDFEYEKAWDDYINKVVFVPLTDKTITDSAYSVILNFKNYFNEFRLIEEENISNIEGVIKHIENGKKHIIIVDDFVGRGYQIIQKFLPKEFNFENNGKHSLIEVIEKYKDINFEFFVLTSSDQGKENIENLGIKFSCIDLYTNEYDILKFNPNMWISEEEHKIFKKVLKQIIQKNEIEFEHTLNLPILFDHSSPKPSHPIYWNSNSQKNWNALRPR